MPPRKRPCAVVVATALALAGPDVAAKPSRECVYDDAQRAEVRRHNEEARQRYKQANFLAAAREWLAAGAALPAGSNACVDEQAVRVDLALDSLEKYVDELHWTADDGPALTAVRAELTAYAARPHSPDALRSKIAAFDGSLACLDAAADRDRALDCTEKGRASKPAATPASPSPPPHFVVEPAQPSPSPSLVVEPTQPDLPPRRGRGLAIGLGVSAGLGAAALVTGIASWTRARTKGPLHHEIATHPDAPKNLSRDKDYCEEARAQEFASSPDLLRLCERHGRVRALSISSYVLAGAFAVATITLAALLARARPSRRTSALRLDLARLPGGLLFGGSGRF